MNYKKLKLNTLYVFEILIVAICLLCGSCKPVDYDYVKINGTMYDNVCIVTENNQKVTLILKDGGRVTFYKGIEPIVVETKIRKY